MATAVQGANTGKLLFHQLKLVNFVILETHDAAASKLRIIAVRAGAVMIAMFACYGMLTSAV